MSGLLPMLEARELVAPLSGHEAETAAGELAGISRLMIYPRSIVAKDGRVYFIGRRGAEKLLCILSRQDSAGFRGETADAAQGCKLTLCARDTANASALAAALPYLNPQCLGVCRSIGMGDRLGLATPGHIRAVRGSGVRPVLAQQSIREMTRTGRTAGQVMEDALWGVFEEGFRDGFGADADHLKSTADLDVTLAAGFRMFTIDPGEYVDNAAGQESIAVLADKLKEIPWADLETTEADCRKAFLGPPHRVGYDLDLAFDEETLLRAVVKYGRAVVHAKRMHRHLALAAAGRPFELEMSVDETDSPTTPHEHYYIAHELKRLGVPVVSLAPRFIGAFEKGIDYKGDLRAFEAAFAQHVKIARHVGPYKISLHSGSDKFLIYPIAAKHARELIHVKTAGTSYLEAVRTVAEVQPDLFREILAFALERYGEDKASYHVSANPAAVPAPDHLPDRQLASVLSSNDGRQVLHVTYGSVLTVKDSAGNYRFRDRLLKALASNEDVHYEIVARHLRRHVEPFAEAR
jgi:tagaturonate epimerase